MTIESNITEIAQKFENAGPEAKKLAAAVMGKFSLDVYRKIVKDSPVGNPDLPGKKRKRSRGNTGGSFRAAWQISDVSGPGFIFSKKITNNLPYAEPLVAGSPVGGRPWPGVGPKTIKKDGRIFSRQAPEGISINTAEIQDVQDKLINVINGILS